MMCFFFFNDTATTEIYTLSLHDALPICSSRNTWRFAASAAKSSRRCLRHCGRPEKLNGRVISVQCSDLLPIWRDRKSTRLNSSRQYLVCRLLLEKKKKHYYTM